MRRTWNGMTWVIKTAIWYATWPSMENLKGKASTWRYGADILNFRLIWTMYQSHVTCYVTLNVLSFFGTFSFSDVCPVHDRLPDWSNQEPKLCGGQGVIKTWGWEFELDLEVCTLYYRVRHGATFELLSVGGKLVCVGGVIEKNKLWHRSGTESYRRGTEISSRPLPAGFCEWDKMWKSRVGHILTFFFSWSGQKRDRTL